MTRNIIAVLLLSAALPSAAFAAVPQKPALAPMRPKAAPSVPPQLLEIEVHAKFQDIKATARYKTLNATQNNFVRSSDKDRKNFIVNTLPVLVPESDLVDIQVQVELSSLGAEKATFQFQTEVLVRLGKKTLVLKSPDTRLEVTVRLVVPD